MTRSQERNASLEVTFKSRGRSAREWTARFEFGSEHANSLAALEEAWKLNAAIIASQAAA